MNEQLQQYAREILKSDLVTLPEAHQMIFKRMYSHKDLSADINTVVDNMPESKLDWAMQQVKHSLIKIGVN